MNPKENYFDYYRKLLFKTLEEKSLTGEPLIFTKVEHSSTLATETYLDLKAKGYEPAEANTLALKILFANYDIK